MMFALSSFLIKTKIHVNVELAVFSWVKINCHHSTERRGIVEKVVILIIKFFTKINGSKIFETRLLEWLE